MTRQPYIGITGFMSRDEVDAVLEDMPTNPARKLMVGVLASSKTLRGETNKYPGRYPTMDRIGSIFVNDPRVINLVHYATDDRHTLPEQLEELETRTGPFHQGYQLNMKWPEPGTVAKAVRTDHRVILQIGRGALEEIGDDAHALVEVLDHYDGIVTDVLIDPSGGKGLPFDPDRAHSHLRAVAARHPSLGIGVAGGLSPETLDLVEPLVKDFPNLSIDAEGRLRTKPDDALDLGRAREYLTRALALFS